MKDFYGREVTGTGPFDASRTRQSDAESCDLNKIMDRYDKTGVMPVGYPEGGVFADVSELGSYQDVMNQVALARAGFEALPAKVRAQFDNDPVKFLDFSADPANAEQLVELGLAEKPPEVAAPVAPEEPKA